MELVEAENAMDVEDKNEPTTTTRSTFEDKKRTLIESTWQT